MIQNLKKKMKMLLLYINLDFYMVIMDNICIYNNIININSNEILITYEMDEIKKINQLK